MKLNDCRKRPIIKFKDVHYGDVFEVRTGSLSGLFCMKVDVDTYIRDYYDVSVSSVIKAVELSTGTIKFISDDEKVVVLKSTLNLE